MKSSERFQKGKSISSRKMNNSIFEQGEAGFVFGEIVTEGMERELREAKRLGLPAHFVREVRA